MFHAIIWFYVTLSARLYVITSILKPPFSIFLASVDDGYLMPHAVFIMIAALSVMRVRTTGRRSPWSDELTDVVYDLGFSCGERRVSG